MSLAPARILGRQDTPPAVARALAAATLAGLEGELAVLDPSCGAGPLLVAAAAATASARLVGADVDGAALEETRATLGAHGLTARLHELDALEGTASDLLDRLGEPRGFDAVLANPPWVSFSGREAVSFGAAERASLRARYESFARWPQLQGPFLERALELVRPGGRVGFVLPRQVLELAGYAPLRRAATARGRVLEVRDLGENVFDGVCEPTATVVLERVSAGGATPSEAPWGPRAATIALWARRVLERLARFPRLPRAAIGDTGVHSGNAASVIIKDAPGPGLLPCREGKDVRPFALARPRRFVVAKPRLEPPLYARVAPLERFLEAAVLVRQTADRPIAARHAPGAAFRNSALAVTCPPGAPVELVLAVLNSRLLALDHRARTADARQKSFPQVKVAALAALPFPASVPARVLERVVSLVRARERGDASVEQALETLVGELFGIDRDALEALRSWSLDAPAPRGGKRA